MARDVIGVKGFLKMFGSYYISYFFFFSVSVPDMHYDCK